MVSLPKTLFLLVACIGLLIGGAAGFGMQIPPSDEPTLTPPRRAGGFPRRGNRGGRDERRPSRSSFPTWEVPQEFEADVFTFARIQFDSRGPFGWHDRWDNDYPDADWNFSLRLQQLTSMYVNPDAKVLRLSDPNLLEHPFVYFAGVQYITLSPAERAGFRRYLENGGFFMMDDLWGLESRSHVLNVMRSVLPDAQPVELTIGHPIFHMVYDLKELPQVTDYLTWSRGARFEFAHEGSAGDTLPHFLAYYDKQDRMVGLVCHNNDIGDGWEREGEHEEYFRLYSLKHSYPFGINLLSYVMAN